MSILETEETKISEKSSDYDIKKAKRKLKLRRIRQFLFAFMGYEVIISIALILPIRMGMIPNSSQFTITISVLAYILYIYLCFRRCTDIYFKECVPRLYFKTAIPAYLIFVLFGALMCKFWKNGVVWFFMPMRALRAAGNSNLVSFGVGYIILFLVIIVSFVLCWLRVESHKRA